MNPRLRQKLKNTLRSLAFGVEPNKWISVCSRNHMNVTNGFDNIPSIYAIKVPRFTPYINDPGYMCWLSHIAVINANMMDQ
jgi:hypothetical protein